MMHMVIVLIIPGLFPFPEIRTLGLSPSKNNNFYFLLERIKIERH